MNDHNVRKQQQHHDEARKGLARLLLSKFSSTPLQENEYTQLDEAKLRKQLENPRNDLQHDAALTETEREYLQDLLNNGDVHSLSTASAILQDESLFPSSRNLQEDGNNDDNDDDSSKNSVLSGASSNEDDHHNHHRRRRPTRDSLIQQQLFRLHENEDVSPRIVLQKMQLAHRNSLLDDGSRSVSESMRLRSTSPDILQQHFIEEEEEEVAPDGKQSSKTDDHPPTTTQSNLDTTATKTTTTWNPFEDISSWLDGSQGVEVNQTGIVASKTSDEQEDQHNLPPFRILGTSADDASCHPHVLSPPLMESLLQFVPEYADLSSSRNFWLKYSLVRDGPGIFPFLRQGRASTVCLLAVETDDGHVLGSFTSQPWRLAEGWYGSQDTFLWKMRRSRLQLKDSILDQVAQESEIQVYPYRSGNAAIQYCSKKCLMLGQGEVLPSPALKREPPVGKHYGYGLYLDKDFQHGTTSSSETFGNPCLVDSGARGCRFTVANVEVWTLTTHSNVEEATQAELSHLFLDSGRESSKLNFMNILAPPI